MTDRIALCKTIGQVLMPDRFIESDKDEFGLAYMCEDETAEKYTLFPTQLIIRFKAGEVEIEFENERHEIGRFVYKEEESYCDLNAALIDKINQQLSGLGFETDYVTIVQAVVVTYFANKG